LEIPANLVASVLKNILGFPSQNHHTLSFGIKAAQSQKVGTNVITRVLGK
jgi:hypothetical protein